MFGNEPCVEDHFAVFAWNRTRHIEIGDTNRRYSDPSPGSGHVRFQGVQSLRKPVHGIRFIFIGATGSGANTKPLLSTIARTLLAFLMFVAGIADAIATFLRATVLEPSP